MLLDVTKLDGERQLTVGNALREAIVKPRNPALLAGTLARGEVVLAMTTELRSAIGAPPGLVDRATGTVVTAFRNAVMEQERALLDTVAPLREAQQQAASRLQLIRTRVFVNGTRFIRKAMDLEWSALCEMREAMQDPEVAAAIDAQGLRAVADHLLTHIGLYAVALGHEAGSAGSAEEKASAGWHEAFKRFAAQVLLDYENDEALRRELLGVYESQLEEQRAAQRAARARRSAAQESPADSAASPSP